MQTKTAGFTLIELLVTLAIVSTLLALSGPAISALTGANTVNGTITKLAGTLEAARVYAMANNTYVRVGFGPAAGSAPALVVLCLNPGDGNPDAGDMASASDWPAIAPPLVLANFQFSDGLGTPGDATPSGTDVAPFTRRVAGYGPVRFDRCVQFGPSGAARVTTTAPARYIKVALDRPAPLAGRNPFVLRLEGLTGAMAILRKEDL